MKNFLFRLVFIMLTIFSLGNLFAEDTSSDPIYDSAFFLKLSAATDEIVDARDWYDVILTYLTKIGKDEGDLDYNIKWVINYADFAIENADKAKAYLTQAEYMLRDSSDLYDDEADTLYRYANKMDRLSDILRLMKEIAKDYSIADQANEDKINSFYDHVESINLDLIVSSLNDKGFFDQ